MAGRPVIVELNGHFVIAIGIIDGGSGYNGIRVMDPADGVPKTLQEAVERKKNGQPVLGLQTTTPGLGKN